MLRSRRDIENVDKQLVQLIVLVSMLPMMAGILKIVRYSVGEMRPMAATALPALDWFSGRPACPRRPHCPRCPTHNTHTPFDPSSREVTTANGLGSLGRKDGTGDPDRYMREDKLPRKATRSRSTYPTQRRMRNTWTVQSESPEQPDPNDAPD